MLVVRITGQFVYKGKTNYEIWTISTTYLYSSMSLERLLFLVSVHCVPTFSNDVSAISQNSCKRIRDYVAEGLYRNKDLRKIAGSSIFIRVEKIRPVLHTKVSAYLIKNTFYAFCTYVVNVKDFYRKKYSSIKTERSLCINELDDSRVEVAKLRLDT